MPNVAPAGLATAAVLVAALLFAALPAHGTAGTVAGLPGETPTATPSVVPAETTSPTPGQTETPPVPPSPTPTPTPTTTGPPDDRLLPDLVALPAGKPRIQVRSDGRFLRFQSSLGNIGPGPVEIRPSRSVPCPVGQQHSTQVIYRDVNGNGRFSRSADTLVSRHAAGCMVYHASHRHWHFQASARYTLVDPSQESRTVVSARRKVSFCLRDSARVPVRYGTFTSSDAYGSCTRTAPQGISVGWMDVYQSWLAGQSLRLPKDLTDGVYCLETTVDPLDQLLESNNQNNKSLRAVLIRGNRVAVHEASRCRR